MMSGTDFQMTEEKRVHVHMYVYIYVYIHMHTHTECMKNKANINS